MGKIKVSELAKKVNMSEDMLIKKLKSMSVDVKTSADLVDESVVSRLSSSSGPHIIRRKVKVVTTDEEGNKVEKITTNAGGTIQQSVIREKKQEKPAYSKEGLGVVKSNRSRNNRNVMQNIVVTQNGKKIEPKVEPKVEKPVEKSYDRPEVSVADAKRIVNSFAEQREQLRNERREQNVRPANNNQNKFQRNNNSRPNSNFNRNAKPGDRNGRTDLKNRPQGQSSGYKVNKFIKETGLTDNIQKETRDYSTTLIDKKKYNTEKNDRKEETRRQSKNANEMREQNTRMDFSKFRGMQVSEDGLMDLYDRGENRKGSAKRKKQKVEMQQTKIIPLTEVELPESMSVKDFAEKLKKQASEIIKKMFSMGIMATVNQEIDFDTAFLIASEFGLNATKQVVVTEEDVLFDDSED
ncbi:MAG: translation initiation factor IF-2 N-terminal domain-containing protein, partial [Clostridia bacterium]|nr:translation initiation factor IF-2 N-terminal domain-containing protein [Clostridia bacterium]